jgi:hypothetical protein
MQMADFDAPYVKDHIATIHTPDSWARSVSEQALNEAIKKMKGGTVPSVTVDAKFHITAVQAKGCIQICGEIGGVMVCTHINV